MTTTDWRDHFLAKRTKTGPKWETPGDLAKVITPSTVQTPALDLIDQKLVEAFNTPDSRLIISMPPQEGKSTRAAKDFPIWALHQNPDTRIFSASYSQRLAERNGRSIRNAIRENPSLGISIAKDNGSVSEWTLDGHEGGVFSSSIGGTGSGRPADLMIIDDPIKDRKEADSKVMRDSVWDWWTDVALARLAPGTAVVIILTRWHSDDLAGRLLAEADSDWEFLNIPARANHRPEKGETDVLGREPDEYMVSARGRTTAQWESREKASGPKTWAALYQGSPSPDEGGVFPKEDEWARYSQPLWIEHQDGRRTVPGIRRGDQELIQSWDLAFKDTKSSDYVVGQVWLRIGAQAYLLDMVRERLNFNQTVDAIKAMSARWPEAIAKLIEDKANGPAVINALHRQVNGLIPIEPEGSKYARASAVSPLVWSKDVILPEPHLLPNVKELLEEAKTFPNSPHDDTIDALSQAINRILLMPILDGGFIQPAEYDDYDDRGWVISPH